MLAEKKKQEKANPERVSKTFLGNAEKRFIVWFESIAPDWVSPDLMTLIGAIGSVLILAGYILTNVHPAFLWLASFGFVLNWFGDSLDGNLARMRHIERPRYGYFVDHSIDTISMLFVFFGLGFTPFVNIIYAQSALITYFLLNLHTYINTQVSEEFQLSYAMLGPTEGRLIFVVGNVIMFFVGNQGFNAFGHHFSIYDGYFIFWALFMLTLYTVGVVSGVVKLYKEEPPIKYTRPKA